jgi:hypothetical protein
MPIAPVWRRKRVAPRPEQAIENGRRALRAGHEIRAEVEGSDKPIRLRHTLSERQIDVLLAGGAINWRRGRQSFVRQTKRPGVGDADYLDRISSF